MEEAEATFVRHLLRAVPGTGCVVYSVQWWESTAVVIPISSSLLDLFGLTVLETYFSCLADGIGRTACVFIEGAWVETYLVTRD